MYVLLNICIIDSFNKSPFSFLNCCQVSEEEYYKFTSIFLLKIICNFIIIKFNYKYKPK